MTAQAPRCDLTETLRDLNAVTLVSELREGEPLHPLLRVALRRLELLHGRIVQQAGKLMDLQDYRTASGLFYLATLLARVLAGLWPVFRDEASLDSADLIGIKDVRDYLAECIQKLHRPHVELAKPAPPDHGPPLTPQQDHICRVLFELASNHEGRFDLVAVAAMSGEGCVIVASGMSGEPERFRKLGKFAAKELSEEVGRTVTFDFVAAIGGWFDADGGHGVVLAAYSGKDAAPRCKFWQRQGQELVQLPHGENVLGAYIPSLWAGLS